MARMHQGDEFEVAYSDIQRETGAASVTLKRALQALQADNIIKVAPGRNSRYGRFRYLLTPTASSDSVADMASEDSRAEAPESLSEPQVQSSDDNLATIAADVKELNYWVETFRRRLRAQEMTIALLQERMAELEDKMYRK